MKKILIKLFFREKFIGQLANAAASAAAAYLLSLIPKMPDVVLVLLRAVLEIPPGVEITHAGVTAMLTLPIMAIINAVIQEYIAKDNNKVLQTLKNEGVYNGPLDSWVGPIAEAGVQKLVTEAESFPYKK